MQLPEIETGDALRITGCSKRDWRMATGRNEFQCAPPADAGNRRVWDLDRLVCLAWFNSLHLAGMTRSFAGQCAMGLLRAMQDYPRAGTFSVYAIERGDYGELLFCTEPPDDPTATLIFIVPIVHWRASIELAVDRYFEAQAGRDGQPA